MKKNLVFISLLLIGALGFAQEGNEEAQKICKKPMSRIVMARLGVKKPRL